MPLLGTRTPSWQQCQQAVVALRKGHCWPACPLLGPLGDDAWTASIAQVSLQCDGTCWEIEAGALTSCLYGELCNNEAPLEGEDMHRPRAIAHAAGGVGDVSWAQYSKLPLAIMAVRFHALT
mmetsp:Transcript_8973/g.22449  ORF Transcript_8973/g.22449 Transcript_8973/m.22449 type:complete len:122 (-) Transcript_8973:458-823(-)